MSSALFNLKGGTIIISLSIQPLCLYQKYNQNIKTVLNNIPVMSLTPELTINSYRSPIGTISKFSHKAYLTYRCSCQYILIYLPVTRYLHRVF